MEFNGKVIGQDDDPKPMWNLDSSTYLNHSEADIEAKAFAMFYIHITLPGDQLELFQRRRQDNIEDMKPNNKLLPWNYPVSSCL